jgi:UTP:GlnB (protein PII) uridylyltransferase
MMQNHHSFPYVKKMDQVGLLAALFPELEKGKQIPQHKYRSANLKDHSLVCYDIMECIIREERYRVFHPYNHLFARFVRQHSTMLKLAALLHDIGKLYTMRTGRSSAFLDTRKKGSIAIKGGLSA